MLNKEIGGTPSQPYPLLWILFDCMAWLLREARRYWVRISSCGGSPRTADQLERERRAWLEGTGRITDGTVIDVQELAAATNHHAAIMLIYKYDVAGVSYECSQDVTYLRHWINLHSCRLGLHTSVKYDPQNPGNSLVVSENWMGLRQ